MPVQLFRWVKRIRTFNISLNDKNVGFWYRASIKLITCQKEHQKVSEMRHVWYS